MKADGGPAFPIPVISQNQTTGETSIWQTEGGMSLRDYFAGQALAGIAGHLGGPEIRAGETPSQAHARWSYGVADAMLAERKK